MYWIFQGNPEVFNIDEYVSKNKILSWRVKAKKHREEISLGDTVFIWRTAKGSNLSGGIIALAEVIGRPYYSEKEQENTIDLKILEYRLAEEDGMIKRDDLKKSIFTRFINILRSPQGTNFICTEEQGKFIKSYWKDEELLNKQIEKSILEQYLDVFKAERLSWFKNASFVKEYYRFFSEFKKIENLKTMEWINIQQIGEHLNCFHSNALAKKRALGKPNAQIEKYRESFEYLIHGSDSIDIRINRFKEDEKYKLFGLGNSAITEIIGNCFPEQYCFYNTVDKIVLEKLLDLGFSKKRGESIGSEFKRYNELLSEIIVPKYKEIIGELIELPIFLEIDQFFTFIYERDSKYIKIKGEEEDINIDNSKVGNIIEESKEDYSSKKDTKLLDEEYLLENFLAEVFVDKKRAIEIAELLDYKKNIILQGPPGVGKTFMAKRLAYYHSGKKEKENVFMIQFHQNYGYEDFIRGFKPNKEGNFTIKDGIFYKICEKAKTDSKNNYYLVIDEINRGNLSKIFGELLMLIENDKRGKDYEVILSCSTDEEKFSIPENLYIIGTMNTADRSIAVVDYALRRRFCFIDVEPGFNKEAFSNHLSLKSVSEDTILKIIESMNYVNRIIENDNVELGAAYKIGHSYFCNTSNLEDEEKWYKRIIKYEIKPLLEEYWFDDKEKVSDIIEKIK